MKYPKFEKAASSSATVDQSARPDPQAQAEARRAKSVQQAFVARHLAVPAQFSAMVGLETLDGLGAKFYMDMVKLEAGKLTDPIERMLLEQIMLAHHHIAMLHATAATSKTTNEIKVHYGVLARLMGEFRRFALAIRIYRQPATQKSFSVVKQQNVVANGEQTVTYVTGTKNKKETLSVKRKLKRKAPDGIEQRINGDGNLNQESKARRSRSKERSFETPVV